MKGRLKGVWSRAGAAVAICAATAVAAQAQEGNGFLFSAPSASLTIRAGLANSRGQSDIFDDVLSQFTLRHSDFDAGTIQGDLAFRMAPRLELVFGSGYAGSQKGSEYRNFVDQDTQPINQTTSLERADFTAGLKAYLIPPGHSIGRFAWVPSAVAPYVEAAAGTMWYKFDQRGDFIDFQTNDVINGELSSSGWGPTYHAAVGADFAMSPLFGFTMEGRYTWAHADVGDDFTGYKPIDLSGYTVTAGLLVRF